MGIVDLMTARPDRWNESAAARKEHRAKANSRPKETSKHV